jgi:ribosomal protein S6
MMIIATDIGEQPQADIFQKIIKKIESLGGKVLNSKIWAKERDLCYSIKSRGAEKKKYKKGCFWLINFSLEIEKLVELKETIRLEENIIKNVMLSRQNTAGEKA